MASEKTYAFSGTATVSVESRIEATSERKARAMLAKGECEWVCDQVDGEVYDIELTEEIE